MTGKREEWRKAIGECKQDLLRRDKTWGRVYAECVAVGEAVSKGNHQRGGDKKAKVDMPVAGGSRHGGGPFNMGERRRNGRGVVKGNGGYK